MRFDGQTWSTFTTTDGLADDLIRAVAITPWTTYTEADGLADNWDTTIAAAPDGAVWIATDGGVSRYVPPR